MAKLVATATKPTTLPSTAPTTKSWLTPGNMRLLEAICDTLIPLLEAPDGVDPHGFWERPASAMSVAQVIAETLSTEDKETRGEFRQLLGIIRGPAGGLLLIGRPIGFVRMTPELREKALRAMENSSIAKLRQGFQGIKRLTMFIYYSAPTPEGGDNPNWPAIGFTPPPAPPQLAKPIHP